MKIGLVDAEIIDLLDSESLKIVSNSRIASLVLTVYNVVLTQQIL